MTVLSNNLIGEALLEAGIINSENLKSILAEEKSTKISFCRLLIDKKIISEDQLLAIMEREFDLPQVNLATFKINPKAIDLIPHELAKRLKVIPLKISGSRIFMAMADPLNTAALNELALATGAEVYPVLAGERAITEVINQYYSNGENPENSFTEMEPPIARIDQSGDLKTDADEATVVRTVNNLICRAITEGASDIHLEPSDDGLRIRMRLDGVLHDLNYQHNHKQAHIISRIKIMANLDIAEKRLPQDGNIQMYDGTREVNLRVSTMPAINGEKVVIRLLEKERIVLPLEQLGFAENYYRAFIRLLLNRSGMVLVTGPTGCGKTTTLYSALNYLNRPEDNIITVEDPVECRLRGINQIQINRRIDRTFANTLRSILRQDPDIIMIGEIRDLETAKIATQAALTGHLVLSTLHTNNAVGAVTRLIDMGLEPYLVTASLVGVIAQRLIRIICPHCREEYSLPEEENTFYRKYFQREPPLTLYRGNKCSLCNQTGYRGRTSIQELLLLNHDLQNLILKGATAIDLQEEAVGQGMQPLVMDSLRCLEEGITTLGEVVRTTFSSVFDADASDYTESSSFITQLQKYRD